MTFGRSKTVEEFLKAAHRKRTFQVIVAESAPQYDVNMLTTQIHRAATCFIIIKIWH